MLAAVETEAKFALGERLNISGKRFRCNFIKPGLVSYIDRGANGYELLRKETIDAYLNTMIGAPLTIEHVTTLQPCPADRIKGRVDKVDYDLKSGWYVCEGTIDDDAAREVINACESASCGYRVPPGKDSYGPGGAEHNIPYVAEIKALKFHHLAVTSSAPRYEDAIIRLNAKTQESPAMSKFTWIKKLFTAAPAAGGAPVESTATGEIDADASIEIDGQPVRLNELVDERKKALKAKADKDKADADAKAKETAEKLNALSPDMLIEVEPGVSVTVAELVADRQNALKAKKAKDDADAIERENAKKVGADSYKILANARNTAPLATPITTNSDSQTEQLARGREMFGSPGRN